MTGVLNKEPQRDPITAKKIGVVMKGGKKYLKKVYTLKKIASGYAYCKSQWLMQQVVSMKLLKDGQKPLLVLWLEELYMRKCCKLQWKLLTLFRRMVEICQACLHL